MTDVHLVEASPELRKMQRAALVQGSNESDVIRIEGNKEEAAIETIQRPDGIKVSWHDAIEVVPGNTAINKKRQERKTDR